MNNFVINLFIPYTQDGSSAAIIAHMCAHDHQGTVSIVRCRDYEEANQKIQELLRHITIADGYNAPQPQHREIWIIGFQLKEMIYEELVWFKNFKLGRSFIKAFSASELLYDYLIPNGYSPCGLRRYLYKASFPNDNYALLYCMVDREEYENLMSYLLREHPQAEDVTKEDYVLNMFIEHEKKKK